MEHTCRGSSKLLTLRAAPQIGGQADAVMRNTRPAPLSIVAPASNSWGFDTLKYGEASEKASSLLKRRPYEGELSTETGLP